MLMTRAITGPELRFGVYIAIVGIACGCVTTDPETGRSEAVLDLIDERIEEWALAEEDKEKANGNPDSSE